MALILVDQHLANVLASFECCIHRVLGGNLFWSANRRPPDQSSFPMTQDVGVCVCGELKTFCSFLPKVIRSTFVSTITMKRFLRFAVFDFKSLDFTLRAHTHTHTHGLYSFLSTLEFLSNFIEQKHCESHSDTVYLFRKCNLFSSHLAP